VRRVSVHSNALAAQHHKPNDPRSGRMHESAGRQFSAEETEVAWAAGLWTRAFNVKKWHRDGYSA
jgi:hypothetical protein